MPSYGINLLQLTQLGKFLVNNYRQALEVIAQQPQIQESMRRLQIRDEAIFMHWLDEERNYLKNLSREPPQETLEIDYYLRLCELKNLT